MEECTVQASLLHLGSTAVLACLGGFLLSRVLHRHWGLSHLLEECGVALFEVTIFTAFVCFGLLLKGGAH